MPTRYTVYWSKMVVINEDRVKTVREIRTNLTPEEKDSLLQDCRHEGILPFVSSHFVSGNA